MENNEIISVVAQLKKGTYVSLIKRKDLGQGVVKITSMVIRTGINFANMQVNKDRQVGQLPWGNWVAGLENYVIEHKGKFYLRVYNSYSDSIASVYYLNGNEITKEQAIAIVGEKKLESHSSECYNIAFDNIVSIATSK